MKKSVVFLFCLVSSTAYAESYNIETYRLFGPEHPGQYKHPVSITQLTKGDLYIAYYGGSGEYGDDTVVYGSRLKVGETQWTEPKVIANTPDRGEGNPVVWQAPDGVTPITFTTTPDGSTLEYLSTFNEEDRHEGFFDNENVLGCLDSCLGRHGYFRRTRGILLQCIGLRSCR